MDFWFRIDWKCWTNCKIRAQQKEFCDKEVGKSKVTRNKLSEDIDGLAAAIEDGKAKIMMAKA